MGSRNVACSATGEAAGVPFVDVGRQHREVDHELRDAFDRVASRATFTLGEEVEAFEAEFAAFLGASDAVGVGSGTDALHFALRACGVGPGDEVITAVNTFTATAEAIEMCGARPVFVDVDERTYLIDLDRVEEAVTARTRAVVPVHLYGQAVDMPALRSITDRRGLAIVEDACQAHGARANGGMAGALGDAGCFSFYPSKNLGAMGDGGIVVTSDPRIAARVRSLRNHGEGAGRVHHESGYCSRLHGMQAALLRAKLPRLAEWNESRRETAAAYTAALASSPVVVPAVEPGRDHVFHLYVIRSAHREKLRGALAARGVQTAIHYPLPLHLEPAYARLRYPAGSFPVAELVSTQILSLPMFPYLTPAEVERVTEAVLTADE